MRLVAAKGSMHIAMHLSAIVGGHAPRAVASMCAAPAALGASSYGTTI